MQMNQVKSSNIKMAGYDSPTNTMRVQFSNGTEYDFVGVKSEVYAEFSAAKSQGKYFNANIKSKYTGSKVEKEDDNK